MSLNDFADMDLLPVLVITAGIMLLIFLFAIPYGKKMAEQKNNEIYGDNSFEKTVSASGVKIVSKYSTPHPLNASILINKVLFEFEDGKRIELALRDPNIYSEIVIGDIGTLDYAGKKFIKFKRS